MIYFNYLVITLITHSSHTLMKYYNQYFDINVHIIIIIILYILAFIRSPPLRQLGDKSENQHRRLYRETQPSNLIPQTRYGKFRSPQWYCFVIR